MEILGARGFSAALPSLLLGAFVFAACGNGSEGSDEDSTDLPAGFSGREFQQLLDNTSDYQRALLEDRRITEAEYEQAVLEAVACMREHGIEVVHLEFDESLSTPQWQYVVEYPDEEMGNDVRRCEQDFLMDVQAFWAVANARTESDLQEQREAVVSCLNDAGIDTPDFETFIQSIEPELTRDDLVAAAECQRDAFGGGSSD